MFGSRQRAASAQLDADLAEARADVHAVTAIVQAMESAKSPDEAIGSALASVRELFGWAYGSYWQLDAADKRAAVLAGERQRQRGLPPGDA